MTDSITIVNEILHPRGSKYYRNSGICFPSDAFVVLGGDPGKGGAIVAMDKEGNIPWSMRNNLPIEEIGHVTWPDFLNSHIPIYGVMEEVHGRPPIRNGKAVSAGHASQFNFGDYTGRMKMLFAMGQFPFEIRPPIWWMNKLGLPKTQGDKKINKEFCEKLVEDRDLCGVNGRVTHATADAILLAECARLLAFEQDYWLSFKCPYNVFVPDEWITTEMIEKARRLHEKGPRKQRKKK